MEVLTLCTVVASLRVLPSTNQFFQYDSITLSCENCDGSSEWKVKRNTSTRVNQECSVTWGTQNGSSCLIDSVYPHDTGVYWCQSEDGECSNAVNISVTKGSVILESPILPVQEGETVTLHCRTKTLSSNLTAGFYKDDLLLGRSSTGNITIRNLVKSDEGLYKCNVSGVGESPVSWLAVRETRHPESSQSSLLRILLPVVGACFSLVLVVFFCSWRSHKGKLEREVSYTEVTITQEVQPKRERDVDTTTVYSTLKIGAT